jgi:hypothetical protein
MATSKTPSLAIPKSFSTSPAQPPATTPDSIPTQSLQEVDINAQCNVPATEQMQLLAAALGFSCPYFKVLPENNSAFVTMYAGFAERDVVKEPRLKEPIGKVEHVFGKKAAKQLCCKEILRVLQQIESERQRSWMG